MEKLYSYLATIVGVLVALMVIVDTWLGDAVHPIWLVLNYLVVITLALGIILNVVGSEANLSQKNTWRTTMLAVFALVLYAGTFIPHENGEAITALNWLLVDAVAVIALLCLGVRPQAGKESG